ncbi:MAG: hypothetical protein AAF611_03720 [Bacteroidota bacterium]
MIRYVLYSILLFVSYANAQEITYQLTPPNDEEQHYLTLVDGEIFYHGIVRKTSSDDPKMTRAYFLSKAIQKARDENGSLRLSFDNFQYSDTVLKVTDFDTSKIEEGVLLSFETYNSMWGTFTGKTISVKATKHRYDSRFDELMFLKVE